MVFHALMHDYDACENIFLKPSSNAKFRKKNYISWITNFLSIF